MLWQRPLPLPIDHFPSIKNDERYVKCKQVLEDCTTEFISSLLGDPIKVKRMYKLWILNRIAVSGVIQPYSIVFDARVSDNTEQLILAEFDILYNLISKELKWQE